MAEGGAAALWERELERTGWSQFPRHMRGGKFLNNFRMASSSCPPKEATAGGWEMATLRSLFDRSGRIRSSQRNFGATSYPRSRTVAPYGREMIRSYQTEDRLAQRTTAPRPGTTRPTSKVSNAECSITRLLLDGDGWPVRSATS